MPRPGRTLPILLAASLMACGRPAPPRVVLITIDTLRADYVGGSRDGVKLTPALDRFARDAIRYTDALANASMTLPSHASMLTGTYPWRHRALANDYTIARDVPTLAEAFKARGLVTGAVVSSYPLRAKRSGLGRGFDSYEHHFDSAELNREHQLVKTPGETTRVALAWIKAHPREPFFLWVHYFPPHGPYVPAPEFLEGLAETPRDPAQALSVSKDNFEVHAIPAYQRYREQTHPDDYRRRYAGAVREVDRHVGLVLEALERAGMYQDATILITSDHGESLGEHDWYFTHGNLVYSDQVRIPLLLKLKAKRAAGSVVSAPVESVDFAPTLLQAAGFAVAPSADGRVILPEALGGPARLRFTQSHAAELVAALEGSRKLILRYPRPLSLIEKSHAERELFDLERDPGESSDLTGTEAATVARLEAILRERYGALRPRPGSLSPEEEEDLRALGYVR